MVSYRKERFEDQVKKIISETFLRELSSENLGFVTVTKVKASPDFQEVKVYISIYENDEKQRNEYFKNIQRLKPQIRFYLGNQLRARLVPEIKFFEDDSQRYAEKIEKLIKKIHEDDNENE